MPTIPLFRRIAVAAFAGALLTAASRARAALTWETQQAEATASAGATSFEAVFRFRNSGDRAVTVTQVVSSCGCTTPRLAKKLYAPAESGEIRAVFEFGDRTGLQQKTVTVTTDDAPAQPVSLVLRVTIPETLSPDRRLLQWSRGADAAPQSILIRANRAAAIADVRIEIDGETIAATLDPLADGSGYRLKVEPKTTAEPLRATVRLLATVNGHPQVLPVYAFVR